MDVDGDAQMDEEEEDDAKVSLPSYALINESKIPIDVACQVYLPGHQMQEDEVLVADSSAYEMLHSMGAEWPCLSFDILRDNLGTSRSTVSPSVASEVDMIRLPTPHITVPNDHLLCGWIASRQSEEQQNLRHEGFAASPNEARRRRRHG